MTTTLFMTILTVGIIVCMSLTEVIKQFYINSGKKASSNIIALVDAILVGLGGTSIMYCLMDIDFTRNNVLCMILITFAIWVGAMLSFDKLLQTIAQIRAVIGSEG